MWNRLLAQTANERKERKHHFFVRLGMSIDLFHLWTRLDLFSHVLIEIFSERQKLTSHLKGFFLIFLETTSSFQYLALTKSIIHNFLFRNMLTIVKQAKDFVNNHSNLYCLLTLENQKFRTKAVPQPPTWNQSFSL